MKVYVENILNDAAQGKATKLSSNSEFVDVQNTTVYQDLIKSCVEESYFSSKTFGFRWRTSATRCPVPAPAAGRRED